MHAVPILQNLIINANLDTVAKLQSALVKAELFVSAFPKDTPYQNFEQRSLSFLFFFFLVPKKKKKSMDRLILDSKLFSIRFKDWGFEKGWGDTAERVKETIRLLSEVLQAPDPAKLELLFSRLPIIFNVVIFSPHGYFGQSDVLGLPDTGGQVYNGSNHHYSITMLMHYEV